MYNLIIRNNLYVQTIRRQPGIGNHPISGRLRDYTRDSSLLNMIKDVEDLEVYNRSMKLLIPIYRLARLLPKGEFKFANQLTNAAKSISAIIAEGFAKRRSTKEFKRFLEMSLGSSDEVITHLRQIKLIGFPKVKAETVDALIKHYRIVSKQINTLIKIWKNFKSDNLTSDFPKSKTVFDRKMMI